MFLPSWISRREDIVVYRAGHADAVALLTQQSASSTLKARPAKLHHAAANVDREYNHAPGSVP
jgi:hypothetical protein